MSKIEELAMEAYPKMSRLSEPNGIYLGDANQDKREGFIAGANAVLKEIEKYADMQDGCYALECIQMRIKELKNI